MPTRNVVLSEHQHKLVETLVASGRYQNASEVLREGLRLIEQRERFEATRLEALKMAVDQGWAAIDAGDYTDVSEDQVDDFINRLSEQAAGLVHAAD